MDIALEKLVENSFYHFLRGKFRELGQAVSIY